MAVEIQVIRFQKTAAGANGQTQDVAVNFTPKAILLFSEGTTADNTLSNNYQLIKGFSDGTNHACVAVASQDGVGTSNTGRLHRNDSVFIRLNSTTPTTTVCRGSCVFQTNNIRFTWDVQDANAYYIGLLVIGGADITNCKVNTVDIGTTGTGNTDYTGLGFTPTSPNGILFTLTGDTQTINTAVDAASITLCAAISSSKRLVYGNASEDNQAIMDTWRYLGTSKALANLDATTGAIDYEADFVDWISDGFRLNITNAASATTEKFSYLAINGGTWDCGTDGARATTGTKTTNVSVSSNTLRGLINLCGEVAVASWDIVSTQARGGIGLSDGTNEFCIGYDDQDGNTDARCVTRNTAANRCFSIILAEATASSSTNFMDADFDSFGTNQFTLNHTVAASSGDLRLFGWIVVADSPAAAAAVEEIFPHSYGKIHQMYDNNTGMAMFG